MFKKNKEDIELDKKTGKRLVKEAKDCLIVINDKQAIINGNVGKTYNGAMELLSTLIDRGIISFSEILDLLDHKVNGTKKEKTNKKVKQPTKKVNKEKKDGAKEKSER